jgi:uncharacterized protein YdhG (YjbR/CyaY superfamily)
MAKTGAPATIDGYIAAFPPDIRQGLQALRDFIRAQAPGASEKISYGMPTFYLDGNLVHFAAFKDHYGFFPAPSGIDRFDAEAAPYRSGKGTLRFSLDKPFPWALLKKIIRFRVRENAARAKAKKG